MAESRALDAGVGRFGHAVEQGNEGAGIGFDVLFERGVIEIEKELHVLGGDGGSHHGGEVSRSGPGGELAQDLLADAVTVAALAGEEPVLVTALAPTFEVVVVEVFGVVAEFGDDSVVGEAVEQQEVEGLAEFFRQARDFAVAGPAGTPRRVRKDAVGHGSELVNQ